MVQGPVPEPTNAWSARDLGAVGLVLLGVWWFGAGVDLATFAMTSDVGMAVALGAIPMWVLSAILILKAGAISKRLSPPGESAAAPEVMPLLAAGIALIGLITVVRHGYALVRLVLPFTEYDQRTPIPAGAIAADLVIVALGVVLFVRSRVLADLWARWNGRS